MKKIILSTLFLAAVLSCKKEKVENTNVNSADSITTSVSEPAPAPLKELTSQQTSELLKSKNDTLYITNFFATWCGPCVREIPHFKKRMEELKGKPVKFTFVSLDSKMDWNTKVSQFVDQQGIRENTILLDGETLNGDFFKNNFEKWDGSSIPFTYLKKGDKISETIGMLDESMLDNEIEKFLKVK